MNPTCGDIPIPMGRMEILRNSTPKTEQSNNQTIEQSKTGQSNKATKTEQSNNRTKQERTNSDKSSISLIFGAFVPAVKF
jgi:hypothetical protein